jgi:hypothetical protein
MDRGGDRVQSSVKRHVTVVSEDEPVAAVGEEPCQQLAFDLPTAEPKLLQAVILAWGQRRMHAVPGDNRTARAFGVDGWPTRAFCGARVDGRDAYGGTTDPDDVSCQGCLRALGRAGVLR